MELVGRVRVVSQGSEQKKRRQIGSKPLYLDKYFDDLNVALPDTVSAPILTPGYVQIPEVEYRHLQSVSAAYSKVTLNGMAKAQKAKVEKKMAAAAAERAKNGLGSFQLPKFRS